MSDLHGLLAQVALVLALIAAGWSMVLVATGRVSGRLYGVNLVWVAIVLIATAGVGLIGLVTGPGPKDALHLVYGVLAVAALPIAAAIGSGQPQRRQLAVGLVASVVLVILVLRAFQTGT